jgi:hypothetical protein
MRHEASSHRRFIALCALLTLGSAIPAMAQTITGQARAIQTTLFTPLGGATTTLLVDTGTLGGPNDAREAAAPAGSVPSVIAGNTLHATTSGWPDEVRSEASLADLTVTVAGVTVGAEFIMARASALYGLSESGTVDIDSLTINGLPVGITGTVNQTIGIPGGLVVINEQTTSPTGIVVNALRITVKGVADVVIASARAGVQ